MVKYLIVDTHKGIPQEVAASQMTRGAFLESGNFIADKERNYDGENAVLDKREQDFETIAQGARYNKIPTRVGEEYATTEVTITGVSANDGLVVSSGKLVKATEGQTATWKYVGTYANPYGLTMYHVKRIG